MVQLAVIIMWVEMLQAKFKLIPIYLKKNSGTIDTVLRAIHSYFAHHIHQFTVFLLDMCMLVELASVCWDSSPECTELFVRSYKRRWQDALHPW